jgi:hypothetical protein
MNDVFIYFDKFYQDYMLKMTKVLLLDGKGHRNSYVRKRRWGVHGILYRKGAMVLYLLL